MSTCCRRATTPARRARTSRPGSPSRRPASTARPGKSSCRTTRCPACTGASAITRARTAATARTWTRRSASTRWSASSATWRSREGWPYPGRRAPHRQARAGGRRRPQRAVRRLPSARLGHAVEIHEAGPVPGGMLHFGIPAYRLPRADLMKEIHRIEAMGVRIVLQPQGRRHPGRAAGRRLRRGVHRDRRACRQARRHPGARRRARARRGRACCAT